MKNVKFAFTRNNVACSGSGDLFNESDLSTLNKYYRSWRDLNDVNLRFNMRRANLPEMLSEGLASALFGWYRTNATTLTGCSSSSCDLVNAETGELIQLKACSTTSITPAGPTSFGPRSEFDALIFMHLDCDANIADFYKLDANVYKDWKVNRTQTIADQQAEGRRPRVTILPKIKESGIKPFFSYKFE